MVSLKGKMSMLIGNILSNPWNYHTNRNNFSRTATACNKIAHLADLADLADLAFFAVQFAFSSQENHLRNTEFNKGFQQ